MREVLLDVSRLIWRLSTGRMPTGIDRICLAYMEHYGPRAQAVVQKDGLRHILSPKASQALFALFREGSPQFKRQVGMVLARSIATSFATTHQPDAIYLNVGHTGLEQSGLGQWAARSGIRPVMMVADLIPITHPEFCRPEEKDKHVKRIENMLRIGAGIIGISKDTIAEIECFAASRNIPMPKAIAAHIGADHDLRPRGDQHPFDGHPYFVILGTIEGRKNHLLLLNIWRDLTARLGKVAPILVVIGQRGWECEQVVDILERCERVRDRVIELSGLPDDAVRCYLEHACALLFPSFVEGYGIPLIEALSLHTPVIASELNVFKELAGDIPTYLSPIDGIGWLRAILEYSDPQNGIRAQKVAALSDFEAPSWQNHFAIVDNWIETL